MTTIAIMQPYFMPYAGYFRLFAAADLLVYHETCTFNKKRGYVHRNQLPNNQGVKTWLTLPLEKAPSNADIDQIAFSHDSKDRLEKQFLRFPALTHPRWQCQSQFWKSQILNQNTDLSAYNINLLQQICTHLELPCRTVTTRQLALPETLKGQDKVIAIAKHFGAKTYLNPPGGTHLYDAATFEKHGLQLDFLKPYQGDYTSILHRIITEPQQAIRDEIYANL